MANYILPVGEARITDDYAAHIRRGSVEPGVDWAVPEGEPVRSIHSGMVIGAGYDAAPGNYVLVSHDDGSRARYLHLSTIGVRKGDYVSQGAVLGRSGNTGRSFGPHLHMTFWAPGNDGGFASSDNFMQYYVNERMDIVSDRLEKIVGGSIKNVPPQGNGPTLMDYARENNKLNKEILAELKGLRIIFGGSVKNAPPTAMEYLRRIDNNTK